MNIVNIGILAHVDAGKTSLTERLLFNAGALKTLGSVDAGTTQTDSLALERQRGITIKTAVTSCTFGDLKINIVDTPGHPDFIAEVERSLAILDAVILVASAVEGVQSQTKLFMRVLQRLRIPTIIFINKIDRAGARHEAVSTEIREYFDDVKRYPILSGSATKNIGIDTLIATIQQQFSANLPSSAGLSARIFKIERDDHNQRVVFARIYAGTFTRHTRTTWGKITRLQYFDNGRVVDAHSARSGEIVKLWGLNDCRVNDYVGDESLGRQSVTLTRPSLAVTIRPHDPSETGALYAALEAVCEQDPFIEARGNPNGTLTLQLCGEVQKEVLQATLQNDYGLMVAFGNIATICIERPQGTGEGLAVGDKNDSYKGTVGLVIQPASAGSGIVYRVHRDAVGKMPRSFYTAIAEAVPDSLKSGLHGWEVTDCVVTLTKVGYWPRQSHAHANFDKSMSSTAGDFRDELTPRAIKQALWQARTSVYEPLQNFELEAPSQSLAVVIAQLTKSEATLFDAPQMHGQNVTITGSMPSRVVYTFQQLVPHLTKGEGVFMTEQGGYQRVA